jgi:hypothetical protein
MTALTVLMGSSLAFRYFRFISFLHLGVRSRGLGVGEAEMAGMGTSPPFIGGHIWDDRLGFGGNSLLVHHSPFYLVQVVVFCFGFCDTSGSDTISCYASVWLFYMYTVSS